MFFLKLRASAPWRFFSHPWLRWMMSGGLAAFASIKENKMIEDKIMKTNLFEVKQLEKGTNLYFFPFHPLRSFACSAPLREFFSIN